MATPHLPARKLRVGILGATGTVGQRFIVLLETHPVFTVHSLGASPRSAGKLYREAVRWKMAQPFSPAVGSLVVNDCQPEQFHDCDVVFSGLDSSVAGEVETAFVRADLPVFSNARNHRMGENVPLVVPTANPEHLDVIKHQRKQLQLQRGFLVTNANCSTTGLVVALRALQDAFGPLAQVIVQTMQAISGAGYPGVSSLDIIDNVMPLISGEEEKMETEALKILGGLQPGARGFQPLTETKVSAMCNRVAVVDGHTECVAVKFTQQPAPSPEQVQQVLTDYTTTAQTLGCYSAARETIVVATEPDRPQPRLDRENHNGYAVTVGRVRRCPVLDVKFTLLVHNTILGAAGSGILNAEIALAKGLLIPLDT
ncbi:aspartate-semialdehyde dehydrogenase [Dispira simplex]|nr:aspartate-semialdehyde dehydrogenase [Dispira simplex]